MFKLTIDFDTESNPTELSDLLSRIGGELRAGALRGYVRDIDGDAVGYYELSD